ncbi:MAG: hypothetical protein J7639_11390 [Paenibacillaceae bacterium]|nr:hypothetical protein [Paenibacillaceae bacterium]
MSEIAIDFSRSAGAIKRLHGVNNGPVGYGELIDVSHHFTEAGIPLVRLHDPNWPYPREVDIHTIFPDFDRDPDDPASYDFSRTDAYVRSVIATGAQIVYRLGQSIEHTAIKYYVHPPQDFAKWARICLGIVRHYNEGWANGFHYGIRYWEVWNEPDNGDSGVMWSGTEQQYFELYRVTATALKAHDPQLQVGGYAACRLELPWLPNFLAFCREHRLPLDFFSWHTYTIDLDRLTRNARKIRGLLDEHGFAGTESHLNEWNYVDLADWKKKLWSPTPEAELARRAMFERAKGVEGAAFAAAALMALQDCGVDQGNYYDGQPSALLCGLFDYYGVPQKTYHAFRAFHELARHSLRVFVSVGAGEEAAGGIVACAGMDEAGDAAVLVANLGAGRVCTIRLDGLPDRSVYAGETLLLDRERDLTPAASVAGLRAGGAAEAFVPEHGVLLLKLLRQ